MCIKIYPDALALTLTDFEGENCINCNQPTYFWHEETNRPICKECAKIMDEIDIPFMPFNY